MTVARDELLETERERVTRQFEAGGSLGLSPAEKVERLSQLRRAKVYLSLTASRRKPPRSPASHNLLKPCPSLARWSGSKRRRRKAEPFKSPADTPKCPECCGNPRLLCRGTSSSNPSPSSGESAANSIWAKAALPMRLPPVTWALGPPARWHRFKSARSAQRTISRVARRDNCRRLDHEDDAFFGGPRAMHHALWDDKGS